MRGFVAAALAVILIAGTAEAQRIVPVPKRPEAPVPDKSFLAADCAVMAAMPSPAMSREACEAMKKQAQGSETAMSQGASAARPGDEIMDCGAIRLELASLGFTGVSRETWSKGVAAAEGYKAREAEVQAQAAGLAAQQAAATVASSAGVPGAGYGLQAQSAQSQAFGVSAGAQLAPYRSQMSAANAASMAELTAQMQANPRIARLIDLGARKNC